MEKINLGVSYYGNRIPWRVKDDLRAIKEAGCTYVIHTFSEEDHEFYQDAMRQIVQLSHEAGLEVWLDPWGIGQAFGGETYSSLVMKRLDLRQVSSNGEILPIICPNQQGFRDYLFQWIDVCAGFKPETLFWDEPHFHIYPEKPEDPEPELWACRCSACETLFKKQFGHPMPQKMTAEVRQFKENSIVEFTRLLCDATKAKGLKAAVCMLPFESSSTVNDWSKMAAIASADIIGTDPYWRRGEPDVAGKVGKAARRISDLAKQYNKEGQIWILNFNIPKGEEPNIRTAINAAYGEGIRNIAAWSYYGAAYINLRAEDPEEVWKTLSSCYQALQKR